MKALAAGAAVVVSCLQRPCRWLLLLRPPPGGCSPGQWVLALPSAPSCPVAPPPPGLPPLLQAAGGGVPAGALAAGERGSLLNAPLTLLLSHPAAAASSLSCHSLPCPPHLRCVQGNEKALGPKLTDPPVYYPFGAGGWHYSPCPFQPLFISPHWHHPPPVCFRPLLRVCCCSRLLAVPPAVRCLLLHPACCWRQALPLLWVSQGLVCAWASASPSRRPGSRCASCTAGGWVGVRAGSLGAGVPAGDAGARG